MILGKIVVSVLVVTLALARLHHQQSVSDMSYYEAMLAKESELKTSLAQIMT